MKINSLSHFDSILYTARQNYRQAIRDGNSTLANLWHKREIKIKADIKAFIMQKDIEDIQETA